LPKWLEAKQAFTRTKAAPRRGKFEWNSRRRFFDEVQSHEDSRNSCCFGARISLEQLRLAALLPDPDESDVVGAETVQVRGAVAAPYVPGGFAAIYWGLTHPIQAWRILAPAQ